MKLAYYLYILHFATNRMITIAKQDQMVTMQGTLISITYTYHEHFHVTNYRYIHCNLISA